MIKRLEALGLISHEPYHDCGSRGAGERVALEVLRHHRLLELYLAEALGFWDRVHEEAEVLEHAISPELSELIAAKLGHPTHDPHGDPIPTRDSEIDERPSQALADLQPGERHLLARVRLEPGHAALPLRTQDRAGRRGRADRPRALRRPAHRARQRARARPWRPARPLPDRGRPGGSPASVGFRPRMALAEDFQRVIDALPPDWTQLGLDLRIFDEDRYVEAATGLLVDQCHALLAGRSRWRIRSAHEFMHAAAAETVHGTSMLDDNGILKRARRCAGAAGAAEVVQMWGRPESVRQEFRRPPRL